MKNISGVLEQKMCCGCGACYSACPKDAVSFIEGVNVNYPKIDEDKCVNCGLCLSICPGEANIQRILDNNKINLEQSMEKIIVTNSKDENIRLKSASGGFITQLIKNRFENKLIDGAVIVKQSKENVLFNEVKIIESVGELEGSQGSRYSPSANCTILKEIINNPKYNKILFVGKPCEIEALSKFQEINKVLREKIKIKVAIMCHHTPTRKGLRKLISANNLEIKEIKKISFRGDGWPGFFKVVNKEGNTFKTSYFDAWNNYLSKDNNEKCNYCENPFPLAADFIVGDPWGEEYKDDNKGKSLVIVRSIEGKNIVEELKMDNDIEYIDVTYDDVKRYQRYLLSRYDEFYVNSIVFKNVHGYKNKISDYIKVCRENPKNILRIIKRINKYKKTYNGWKYE